MSSVSSGILNLSVCIRIYCVLLLCCFVSLLQRVVYRYKFYKLSRDDPGSDIACKRGYLEANASHGALKGCKSFIIGTGRKDARLIRCKYSELIYPYYQKY